MDDLLTIADKTFSSRLLLGTARYPDAATMQQAHEASGTEIVTVSMRRLSPLMPFEGILSFIDRSRLTLLPNTSGCYTAREAVFAAHLAREALQTSWIKLEVIGDEKTLLPDISETLKAAEELVAEGFVVLPYCTDDLVTCLKLVDVGCAAIMPLGSPIGSGMGLCNPYLFRILRERISIPLILDAGVGTASDLTQAMELGCDGVLLNSAVAQALHPVEMAKAMRHACLAGRSAYLAGRIPRRFYAEVF